MFVNLNSFKIFPFLKEVTHIYYESLLSLAHQKIGLMEKISPIKLYTNL